MEWVLLSVTKTVFIGLNIGSNTPYGKNDQYLMMKMTCFCSMVDWQKAFSLISSWDHCQRSSPSWISDTLRAGFELAQNLSLGFLEWSCAVVITTTPWCHCWMKLCSSDNHYTNLLITTPIYLVITAKPNFCHLIADMFYPNHFIHGISILFNALLIAAKIPLAVDSFHMHIS